MGNWWHPEGPPGFSFNMKWRCPAQAGGVEESKFCLFSVVLPVRCVSSVSPRFYFRRHTFCFLPLAAILESNYTDKSLSTKIDNQLDLDCELKFTNPFPRTPSIILCPHVLL
jgi:hypothetical protein